MKFAQHILASAAALALGTGVAAASPIIGLTGDKTLVFFDTENPTVARRMDVIGVDRLVGIDLRPSNRTLIGVTPNNVVYEIDMETGEASMMSEMDTPLMMGDGPVIVDFNPMADKLRYMTGVTNHRVDVDTGAVTVDGSLAFEGNDMHYGEAPNIVAAAYANSYGRPETTAMYDVDATIVALIRQTSPNDGALAAIGKLGIDGAATYAFDIQTTPLGENMGVLMADDMLYMVDLESGAATPVGPLSGATGVRDLTVLP